MKPFDTLPTHQNPSNLLNEIKEKLAQADTKHVLKRMGYQSMRNGMKTLNKFLSSTDCYSWLNSPHYDFYCTSKEFFERLCKALKVEPKLYQDEIDYYVRIDKELEKIQGCYVFVNTNFKRANQPIFALAFMERSRSLHLNRESMMFKSKEDIFSSITKMVREHYAEKKGALRMWGKIENYIYHHYDGKAYVFDAKGNLLTDAEEISEPKATVSIG